MDSHFGAGQGPAESLVPLRRDCVRIQREADEAVSGLLTVRQASAYLATSTTTVGTLARSGAIRSATIGDGLRFRRAWLDEWIDSGGGKIERDRGPRYHRIPKR
jgi:excisionase family DNA binding protein